MKHLLLLTVFIVGCGGDTNTKVVNEVDDCLAVRHGNKIKLYCTDSETEYKCNLKNDDDSED